MPIKGKNPAHTWLLYIQYDKGLKVSQIAEQLGCKAATIYGWCRNDYKISTCYLKKMEQLSNGRFTKEMLRPDLYKKS